MGTTMRAMQEIELKFQIPADALDAVQAELACLDEGSRNPLGALALRAAYFDTPQRHLARSRMALRVRQEGDAWVQTLKSGGTHTMVRLEDNRPATPVAPGEPLQADLSRHSQAAQKALVQALGWQAGQDPQGAQVGLVELYRTDITRHRAHLRVAEGTPYEGRIELALDLGHITAGALSVPVRELEIELLSGHPMAVVLAGHDWVKRRGLWLDTQTKAHRGDALARQAAAQDTNPAADASTGDAGAAQGKLARAPGEAPARSASAHFEAEVAQALSHFTSAMSALAAAPDAPSASGADTLAPALAQACLAVRALRRLIALGRSVELVHTKRVPKTALPQARRLSQQLRARVTAARPAQEAAALRALARSPEVSALCLDVLAAIMPPAALPAVPAEAPASRGPATVGARHDAPRPRSGKGFAKASGKSAFKPARKTTPGPKR